jgi:hypothetical protein
MDDKSKMKVITMDDVTDKIIDFDDLESQFEGKLGEKISEMRKTEDKKIGMKEKELSRCDICKMLVLHLNILFMELERATRENDSNAKCASLLEMKCYYWLTKEYSDKLLNECNCNYRIEFGRILENLKDIFGKDGIVLDENRRKCDICKILPCEFFPLLDRTCSLKAEEDINSMVEELRYHLTLSFIYEEFIGKCTDCEEYIEYIACLQFLCDFLKNNNQQKLQQDVYYWKIATNNDAIWSSADALVRNEKLSWTDVDLKNQIKIYLDFNIYQRYEKEDRVHDFFGTLIQREDVAIVYSGTHLEEIMRMGGEEYKAKRIESIQKLTGDKIAVVGADKKTVICIQDIHKRFGIVKKYWKMNVAAEGRVCIQAEAREHLCLHEFEENQEKAIGSSSLRGILNNIDKSGKKIIEELPDEEYLNKVLRYVGIGDRDIREYADALSDEKKEFSEVRASIVSIAGLLNILGLHGDKIKRKTNPGAVYPIYHKDSFQAIRSSYYDNDHLAFATECTYFVTTDKNLYNKAKEIYCFLGVRTEPILLSDFMELEIWKNNTKKS